MSAPVKHTCPDIDKCIKWLKSAVRVCQDGEKEFKHEKPAEYFSEIISWIEDIEPLLEDLRKSNDELRGWGHELEKDVENAAVEINSLENRLEECSQKSS